MQITLSVQNAKKDAFIGNVVLTGYSYNQVKITMSSEETTTELAICAEDANTLGHALITLAEHVKSNAGY